ncbi:MAG TPA: hypothetical protein ENJ29_01550 [Bacteroidetes bacterium]|nr:hypothetical protein [Bacteroidota bacterium]
MFFKSATEKTWRLCTHHQKNCSCSDCVGWEIIGLQIRPVSRVVKMKFILGSIFRIVDDRIPVATRGVGATGGCGATRRSPLRVSCLLSSTKIALPNGNGVNIGILATISTIWYADLKSRAMAPMDVGMIF